jgi:hypothetical protein
MGIYLLSLHCGKQFSLSDNSYLLTKMKWIGSRFSDGRFRELITAGPFPWRLKNWSME